MRSFRIDMMFGLLAKKVNKGYDQIPVFGVVHIFNKGYTTKYGTVVAKDWPFRLTPKQLTQQFDLLYHVPNHNGQTLTGWTSDEGPYN